MRNSLIITGGPIDLTFAAAFLSGRDYAFITAADAGVGAALSLGIRPDAVIGDFDTYGRDDLDDFIGSSGPDVQSELYSPVKDETDTELAFRALKERGFKSADVLGATGGRKDHELANIFLMRKMLLEGVSLTFYDENNKLSVLDSKIKNTKTFEKGSLYGKYVSFIPLTEEVKGITLTGFRYPLNKKDISVLSEPGLMVSNEIEAEKGVITFRDGALLVVESHD